MAPIPSSNDLPARPTKRQCTRRGHAATTHAITGHAQAHGTAAHVESMSPAAEADASGAHTARGRPTRKRARAPSSPSLDVVRVITMPARMPSGPEHWRREIRDLVAAHVRTADPTTLLRLAKASSKWWMPCIEAAARYATEFLDIFEIETSKEYGGSSFVMTASRTFSTCSRVIQRQKLLTIALPACPSLDDHSYVYLMLAEARDTTESNYWWIPQKETTPVPLVMLRRIAFIGDRPYGPSKIPQGLKACHIANDQFENLLEVVAYLPAITNVTALALMFLLEGYDELKAQMFLAIPRAKIESLELQVHASPAAAAGLLNRPFRNLKSIRSSYHLANQATFLNWLPTTLEDLCLWIPEISKDVAVNLVHPHARLVNLKRFYIEQLTGDLLDSQFTTALDVQTVDRVSKAPLLLAHLPRSLTTLDVTLNLGQTNAIGAFPVPPALQTLILYPIANPLVGIALVQHLPRTLQQLQLANPSPRASWSSVRGTCRRGSDHSRSRARSARGWPALAKALPTTLTHLELLWSEFEVDMDHPTRMAPEDGDAAPLTHAVATRLGKIEHLGLCEFDRGLTDHNVASIVRVLPPSTRSIVADIVRAEGVREHTLESGQWSRYAIVRGPLLELSVMNVVHLFPQFFNALGLWLLGIWARHGRNVRMVAFMPEDGFGETATNGGAR
ncbi:hypothetical protein GGF32_004657 [Allomyces javanicus]|nr:hypothetical protein GGF32_004657 [Allomyces javanicus]